MGDFEDGVRWFVHGGDVFFDAGPVDAAGGFGGEGPEVFVAGAVVVVDVEFDEGFAEVLEGFGHAVLGGDVGVTGVEAEADVGEVADAHDFGEVLGGGYVVGEVFEEELDAERAGEGFEVLDGGEGVVEGAVVPGVVGEAEVEDAVAEGDVFGGFEGALDFVLGVDARGLGGADEVEGGSDVGAPNGVWIERHVEGGADVVGVEPVGELEDGGAVGVVEVMARGEDLDVFGAGGGEGVEHGRVEAAREEDVGGDSDLHCY